MWGPLVLVLVFVLPLLEFEPEVELELLEEPDKLTRSSTGESCSSLRLEFLLVSTRKSYRLTAPSDMPAMRI